MCLVAVSKQLINACGERVCGLLLVLLRDLEGTGDKSPSWRQVRGGRASCLASAPPLAQLSNLTHMLRHVSV